MFVRNKPVFATGIGNVFSPISLSLEGYTLLVVKPGVHVSTAEAYSRVTPRRPAEPLTQLLARPVDEWRGRVVNDFEESVFALHPQVAAVKETLYRAGAVYASMSGSGSAVYGIFREPPAGDVAGAFAGCFVAEIPPTP